MKMTTLALLLGTLMTPPEPNPVGTVLFVCEHGSAKSVVAAAHFNRLAAERGLELRAVSRGTDPDAEIAPNAEVGLKADGLLAVERTPAKLSQADAAVAARVVTFCKLPEGYATAAPVERWDGVPPVSEDYARARDEIVERLVRLLGGLEAGN
jgi:arsenate reductase (thioredoxin)